MGKGTHKERENISLDSEEITLRLTLSLNEEVVWNKVGIWKKVWIRVQYLSLDFYIIIKVYDKNSSHDQLVEPRGHKLTHLYNESTTPLHNCLKRFLY